MKIRAATFLVSGGASGLGAGSARMLAQAGANVVIADLDEVRGHALACEFGAVARFVRTDVTDEASAKIGEAINDALAALIWVVVGMLLSKVIVRFAPAPKAKA